MGLPVSWYVWVIIAIVVVIFLYVLVWAMREDVSNQGGDHNDK